MKDKMKMMKKDSKDMAKKAGYMKGGMVKAKAKAPTKTIKKGK